jgi:fused signal recognition particle receptor
MAKLAGAAMPIEALVLVIVVAVIALAIVVWRRRAALPPAAERALPEPEPEPKIERAPKVVPIAPAAPREGAAPLPVERPKPRGVTEADRHAAREQDRDRIRKGLGKTRGGFVARLARVFRGKPKVGAELRDAIEEVLFTADIGASTAESLMKRVGEELDRREVSDPDAVWAVIEQAARDVLRKPAPPTDYEPAIRPYVLLMIGVNGVGKTTTLGKLAAQQLAAGRKVLLVAGDTFRAGAVDQLDVWARRVGCAIHMGEEKADPSSVIYDGILRGRREGFDVVLCDTAGRLHTKKELMDELGKVRRAATKAIAFERSAAEREAITGVHDTYLVLDATIGQNALAQAKLFKETTDFTGIVVTKLDGTAKGGVVLGVCDELGVPIRYVGIGEGVDDLRPFDPEDFVAALFADRERAAAGDAPDVREA